MQQRFHLFVRQHGNDWLTASVLAHPRYAAFGPKLEPLKAQLAEVLSHELGEGRIGPGDAWFEDVSRRALELELKAVQHDRLIRVPMRFTLVVRPLPEVARDLFEVRIPRLGQVFRISGEDNIAPWSEEMIRGFFHLDPVEALLPYQSARGERLDEVEVTWQRPKSKIARKRAAKRAAAEAEGDRGDFFGFGFGPPPSPLAQVGVELVEEARHGRIERAELRDDLMAQLEGILDSAHARSVLLVGPSGVGKTALVHELAHRIAEDRVPLRLRGVPLWHVTGGRIIAGMKYLGEWQQRCQRIVEEIRNERGILFVESPYELMTAGSAASGMNVASFLLGPMRSGEITVIAEATPDGLLLAEQTHPPFVEALRRVPVPAFAADAARSILERAAVRLAKAYKVRFTPAGLSRAMDVLARFGDADALPGAGLELMEQMARLPAEGGRPAGDARPELGPADAVRAFARRSGFSEALIDPDVLLDADAVRAWFDARVIGQPDATELLSNLVLLIKASLDDPQRPLGSFLFMGPTGVGKTESALTLAEYLFGDRARVIRFDMSEYGYPGSAARLVGIGRSEGDLTRKVREQPFCVLLLDEVEKADGEVFDVLLQVLGEGRLTDGTGRTVRFGHAIVIMTSNLGASDRRRIGLGGIEAPQAMAHHYREAAQAFFRPEFVNRMDFLVPFAALDAAAVRGIARRMLDRALEREGFARRGLTVRARDEVLDLLMAHGFDPKYGARPMKRAVEQRVLVPLSRRLVLRAARPEAPETFDLYVHDGRVAVVSSRGPTGGPCPPLAGLAASHAALWSERIRAIRARLQGWESSRLVHDLRAAGALALPERLAAAEAAVGDLDALAAPGAEAEASTRQVAAQAMDATLAALEWDLCVGSLVASGMASGVTSRGGMENNSGNDSVDAITLEVESPTLHPAGRVAAERLADAYATWAEGRGFAVERAEAGGVRRLRVSGPAAGRILRFELGRHRLLPAEDGERAVDLEVRAVGHAVAEGIVREIAAPDTLWDPSTEVEEATGLDGLAAVLDRFLLARMCRAVG